MLKDALLQLGLSEDQAEKALGLHTEAIKDYVPKSQLEEATSQVAEQAANQIAAYKLDSALNLQLMKSGVKDTTIIKHLLDLSQISLDGDSITGLDNQIEGLKESYEYLFEPSMPHLSGREPNGGGGSQSTRNNPFKKETFNLTEQSRLMRDDPEQAERLRKAAQGN